MQRLDTDLNRVVWGTGGSALLLAGVILGVNGQAEVARWLYAGAGVAFLRVMWLGRRPY